MNEQFRETDNITYTRQMKTKQTEKKYKNKKHTQHNMCWTPLYANTNKVNKTWALLQTTYDHKRAVVRFKCIAKEQKNIMRYYINLHVIILFKWIYNGTKIARTDDLCFTKNTIQWYWIELSCGKRSSNNVSIVVFIFYLGSVLRF